MFPMILVFYLHTKYTHTSIHNYVHVHTFVCVYTFMQVYIFIYILRTLELICFPATSCSNYFILYILKFIFIIQSKLELQLNLIIILSVIIFFVFIYNNHFVLIQSYLSTALDTSFPIFSIISYNTCFLSSAHICYILFELTH